MHKFTLSPRLKHVTERRWVQAVIFIFEHSEQGSAGLILNKPTQYTIGTMSGLEALCPEFSENGLFLVGLYSGLAFYAHARNHLQLHDRGMTP